MHVLGAAAADHLGSPLATIGHAEVYSCFPAAVRVQQRELGLPLDGVPTITGGEPFAGGPWNNFVLQATAAMVERLRADRGSLGLVTTVSGFLTKPGIAVYATEPGASPVLVADLAAEATGATAVAPIAVEYRGPATIAACTVSSERNGDRRVITLVDTPAGERWLTFSSDPAVVDRARREELIGTPVEVDGSDFRIDRVHRSAS
jgi:acetyl-CoA C-acetyltransferase